jgi:ABC-type branched-subunit amino acid transport system substrate-binding protein
MLSPFRALVLSLPLALGACSATRFKNDACRDNDECRSAFGFGFVCGSAGLCDTVRSAARCSTSYPEDLFKRPAQYKDAVVIGSLMDHSAAPHVVRRNAIRMAVKEAADNPLEHRPIAVVFCDIAENTDYDSLKRTDAAAANAKYLATELGVQAIVGPSASVDAQRVWEELHAVGASTVIISPAATGPGLVGLEPESSDAKPGYLWRVAPPDTLQGEVIADDLLERGVKNAVVIHEPGPYGEGLVEVLHQRFMAGGGTVTILPIKTQSEIGEATVTAGTNAAPEVLFIASQQPWIIDFLNAAYPQAEYKAKHIFLTDAAANAAVLMGATKAAALFPRIRGTRPATPTLPAFAIFASGYSSLYNGDNPRTTSYAAHAYDAAWLALYGSAWSLFREKDISGLGIARGLRHVSEGQDVQIVPSSWNVVVNAFRDGTSINLHGASGELDFDPVTRNVVAPIELWEIDGTDAANPVLKGVGIKTPQ